MIYAIPKVLFAKSRLNQATRVTFILIVSTQQQISELKWLLSKAVVRYMQITAHQKYNICF